MTQVATIVAAKQHPLALITSANGDKLQFAPVDSGLRTVGAPVGDPQYRTDWYKEYLSDKIQPTLGVQHGKAAELSTACAARGRGAPRGGGAWLAARVQTGEKRGRNGGLSTP